VPLAKLLPSNVRLWNVRSEGDNDGTNHLAQLFRYYIEKVGVTYPE